MVDVIDEERLCALALQATASQLARMISGFRSCTRQRMEQEQVRRVTWNERTDGSVEIRARLPKEEAALVLAALNRARDHLDPTPDPAEAGPGTPRPSLADGLLEVAGQYLDRAPEDRSGEDRTLVVVHVAAELLTPPAPVPADVPAGTYPELAQVCHVEGVGSVDPATAQRLACEGAVVGAVLDETGDVLALGRTRRLVSRAQRRALMIRDRSMCTYPGCAQTRHLHAHHIVSWAAGGPTDLDNLILLCSRHHTAVHEGGIRISPSGAVSAGRWAFTMPDGRPSDPGMSADDLTFVLARYEREAVTLLDVDRFDHPDATVVRPGWAGERFDLHACVEALFTLRLPDPHTLAA